VGVDAALIPLVNPTKAAGLMTLLEAGVQLGTGQATIQSQYAEFRGLAECGRRQADPSWCFGSFAVMSRRGRVVLTSQTPGSVLHDMEAVLARQSAVARAVRCLPLLDQLEPTLELLRQSAWPEFGAAEGLPPNVVRFRARLR
jgi:hypothetical protein